MHWKLCCSMENQNVRVKHLFFHPNGPKVFIVLVWSSLLYKQFSTIIRMAYGYVKNECKWTFLQIMIMMRSMHSIKEIPYASISYEVNLWNLSTAQVLCISYSLKNICLNIQIKYNLMFHCVKIWNYFLRATIVNT